MIHKTFTPKSQPLCKKQLTTLAKVTQKLLALLLLVGAVGFSRQALAQSGSIDNDGITLGVRPTGQASANSQNYAGTQNDNPYTTYTALGQSSSTTVPVPQLGTYDLNGNSSLVLTAASQTGTVTTSSTNVSATRLQYRVYLVGTTDAMKPGYTNMTLTTSQTQVTSSISTFTGSSSGLSVNLISSLTSGGTYVLDVRFQADLVKGSTTRVLTDLASGDYFYANFYITPPPTTPAGGTTTWQGVSRGSNSSGVVTLPSDTEWTNTANWSM